MYQQAQVNLPQEFINYFRTYLLQLDPNSSVDQDKIYYEKIVKALIADDPNSQIVKNQLAQIGISDSQKIDQFIRKFSLLGKVFKKLQDLVKQRNIRIKSEKLQSLKFLVFVQKEYLENNEVLCYFQKEFCIDIEEEQHQEFFKKINRCLQMEDYQDFKSNITPIIVEFIPTFETKSTNQFKQNVLTFLFKRNQSFIKIKQQLSIIIDEDEILQMINQIFENVFKKQLQSTPNPSHEQEKKQQFIQKTHKLLTLKCKQIQKNIYPEQQVKCLIENLYDQNGKKDRNEIINILKNSGLKQFQEKKKIKYQPPIDFILEIYNLKSENQLKLSDNQINPQQIQYPNSKIKQSELKFFYQSEIKKRLEREQNYENSQIKRKHIQNSQMQSSKIKNLQESKNKQNNGKSQGQNMKYISQSKIQNQRSRLKQEEDYLKQLNEQITSIRSIVKNSFCLEICLRELHKSVLLDNINQIHLQSQKIKEIIQKYKFEENLISDLNQIKLQAWSKNQRLAKIIAIRKKTQYLNLEEIFQIKNKLQNITQCVDADAVLLVGKTGVGKTTLINGLSGHGIQFNSLTNDYQPKNSAMALRYKVSSHTMSVTKAANLSKFPKNWSSGKVISIIDTPGLGDNRGPETDIINNLSTMKVFKKLKTARLIIVISKQQFGDRWYQYLKLFINHLGMYLPNVNDFSSSLTFVLSKGLTKDKFLTQIEAFESCSRYSQQVWTQNQKNVFKILKRKILSLPKINQINDPSEHNYQQLTEKILQLEVTERPGDSIAASYSQQAIRYIKNTFDYLKKMIITTFENGQCLMTKFYLNRIKELEQITCDKYYLNILEQLKCLLQNKFLKAESALNKFVQLGYQQDLIDMKQISTFLNNKDLKLLNRMLQNNKQQTFDQTFNKLISRHIKQIKEKFESPSKIEKSQRKKALSCLSLIKHFRTSIQYDQIKNKIQNQNKKFINKIKESLQDLQFDENKWKDAVFNFKNQFDFETVIVNEQQYIQKIKLLVLAYIQSQPSSVVQINKFLNYAQTQPLNNQLLNVTTEYLNKLNTIKSQHYKIKQAIQPQIQQILSKLQKIIAFYEEQKNKNKQQINVDLWDVYMRNDKEIYIILTKFGGSHLLKFKNHRHQQETLNNIHKDLNQNISNLEKDFDALPLNPQSIDPETIRMKLSKIFKLISFIKKRKQYLEKFDKDNATQIQFLTQSLTNAQVTVQRILRKIDKTAGICRIQKGQVNYKLIVCLLVLEQFSNFAKDQKNQNFILALREKIQNKILQPLQQIDSIEFQSDYQFLKFHKILKYMKQLDQQVNEIALKAHGFNFNKKVNFSQNPQVIKLVKRCFLKIQTNFEAFTKVKELTNIRLSYQNNKIKAAQIKSECVQALDLSLQQKSIQYILSFQQIKNIVRDFSQISLIQDFKNQNLGKSDLKAIIVQRIQMLQEQLTCKITNSTFTRKQLSQIDRQLKFLLRVHQKTRFQQYHNSFENAVNQLNSLVKVHLQNFDQLIDYCTQMYRQVTNGVEFQVLKNLLSHQCKDHGQNPNRIKQIMRLIDNQYRLILQGIFIQFDPHGKISEKTNTFLNIYQFITISQQNNYLFAFDKLLLQKNLGNFFKQLKRAFQTIVRQIQKGNQLNRSEVNSLIKIQKRVIMCLPKQYDAFKKTNALDDNFSDWFQKKCDQVKQNLYKKYMTDNLVVDDGFQQVYKNTNPENKMKMQEVLIKKNNQQFQQMSSLLKDNHEQLQQLLANKQQEIQKKLPQQLGKKINKKFLEILNKKNQQQNIAKNNSISAKNNKNPLNIIDEFGKATKIKSLAIQKEAKCVFQQYLQQQIKQADCDNLKNLTVVLDRNLKLFNDKAFREASQKDQFFAKSQKKFRNQIKSQVSLQNNKIKQQIFKYKMEIVQLNSPEKFNLHQFKEKSNNFTSRAIEIIQLTQNYNNVFKQEHIELKSMIQNQISQNQNTLKKYTEILQQYKKQFLSKMTVPKLQFRQNFRAIHISRHICYSLKQFNKINSLNIRIQMNCISIYDALVQDIKKNFRQKFIEAQKWNLEQSLTNDTLERIAKRSEQTQKDLALLNNFGDIFFSREQIPEKPLENIQKNNEIQFIKFEQKTQQTIINAFQSQNEVGSDIVRRYYDLIKLLANKLEAFPQSMKVSSKIRQLIKQKFKQNIKKIELFSSSEQLIKYFNQLVTIWLSHDQKQTKKISKFTEDIQIQKLEFYTQHKKKLEDMIKTVPEDANKKQKLQKIYKQFQTNKVSKFNDFNTEIDKETKKIKKQTSKQKQKVTKQINQFVYTNITIHLIINRRARSYFSCDEEIDKHPVSLQNLLQKIQRNYSKRISKILYNSLRQCDNPYSYTLLSQQKMFAHFNATTFKEQTEGITFEVLLDKNNDIKNNQDKVTRLKDRYAKYNEKYNYVTQIYKNSNDYKETKNQIINQAILLAEKIKRGYQSSDQDKKGQRWVLLGYIFALWTIIKSQVDEDGKIFYIHKPHPGQILAIFLLLEFDQKQISSNISKTMVQVSTGEGKSVILGALSAYLSLVGFKVFEACYSKYLSQRDYKDFVQLFTQLNVKDRICYDIFPEICKMMLDQSPQKPFTSKVQKFIINPSVWNTVSNYFKSLLPDATKNNSILLIDEADVFLDQNYLGESYYPSINIQKDSIRKLLDFVWGMRDCVEKLTPQLIVSSKEFQLVCRDINSKIFEKIMQNQAHGMIRGLAKYKSDIYCVCDGKIYYKEGDGLSSKIHYGYRTIFSYYHEHYINQRVSVNQLNKQIAVNLIVASFSYSKLPGYFRSILGVTGTLQSMSNGQKHILSNQFGVKKRFIQPSIYSESRRKISFKKCSNTNLYSQIVKNIDQQHSKKRPILVFFKAKAQAYDFFDSKQFSKYLNIGSIITYEVSPRDRDFRIQVSTLESKITILTFDFGRGTDFKLQVKNSKQHPGLHVISSFLPGSFSDYIQLVGRTGRQGKNGSAVIFIPEDLQVPQNKMNVTQQIAQKIIKDADNSYWDKKKQEIFQKIKKADKTHEKNTQLYSFGASTDKIFQNLFALNYEQPFSIKKATSKTVICIDATGSMSAVFPKVIQVAQNAMGDIYQTIKQAKVSGSYELKFVLYRNYSSDFTQILQFTNFESKSQSLVQWLKTVRVSGGQGNEALQTCLQHLNTLPDLSQFLVISDARANSQSQTVSKRQTRGQAYWNNNGFIITDYETQLKKLINKNIKGYSYYLSPSTKSFYEDMSRRTGGQCKQFKINQADATKQFASYVAKMILTNLAGLVGGSATQLINIYENIAKRKTYV